MSSYNNPVFKRFPPEEIMDRLRKFAKLDVDPSEGRLFAYVYETGLDELKEVSHKAYTMFVDKNMLDFTVFPSILEMEKDVVGISAYLLNGSEETSGILTSGGTESNMLAVYAAKKHFISKNGRDTVPELVKPITGHASLDKAADYMDLKVVNTKIDPETLKADPDSIQEVLSDKTAVVVVSAPEWPFGSIDPVKEVAEITSEKGVWLHVDGCLGGFILPFLKKLGEDIPDFDFSVEGVYSVSGDLHKFGYVPKGASLLLFRDKNIKKHAIYVHVRWPGYSMINPGLLSSRSAGPLAASWATMHYLGLDGYLKLTKRILNAKEKILNGFINSGYKLLGEGKTNILSFASDNVNIFQVIDYMKKRGWDILAQPGIPGIVPPNTHLTLMPIHDSIADEFVKDLEEVTQTVKSLPPLDIQPLIDALSSGDLDKIFDALNIRKGKLPEEMALVNEVMRMLPPDIVEDMLRYVVSHLLY